MIRGTTPTHSFGTPIGKSNIKTIRVTYKQGDRKIVERDMDSVEFVGNKVKLTLTQEETLRFEAGIKAKVKIRILATDGKAFGNKRPVLIDVFESYNEEVLT